MKKISKLVSTLIFSTSVFFTGCIDDNPTSPPIQSPTPISSFTPKPSTTPTVSPTPSATPTSTITPSISPTPTSSPSSVSEYPSWAEVFFSQVSLVETVPAEENIDAKLVEKLSKAQKTVDCALYELDSIVIADALIAAKNRGVQVRIVTDTDYILNEAVKKVIAQGIPVVEDNRSAIMHDKFIIIDSEYVWTGSFNTTDNDAGRNNNNAIMIKSKELSENYTTEFKEMFIDKKFGPTSPAYIPYPNISMPDGTELVTLFSPENDADKFIIQEINNAKKSIHFMAFSFTHDKIGDAMIEKFKQGLDVRGVFETRGAKTIYSEYPKMKTAGLDVRLDANKYNLHHKVIIIDDKEVLMGSFNFSENATSTNDENLLTIKNNDFIAKNYNDEFNSLYSIAIKE
ncbi:MAG: phospholipase D-like domain-containing protein [Candidatus Sericytochromatia bacterium]